jgi:hypothetical protein
MSYEKNHHFTMALHGRQHKHDATKGAVLFFVMLVIIFSTAFLGGSNTNNGPYYKSDRSTLFSCIEYNESYMTCSLGNLK